jgi:hypothetical protein
MSEHLTWWVGDRDPSIADQITVDGVPVDLSAKAAQFKMRAVGSTALKVNQPVSFKDASGNWRYDWGATDLNTADDYLAWVEVTSAAKVQTLWESLIEVRAHAPLTNGYVELEELKSSTELTSASFADSDLKTAIVAASRGIDGACGRRFYPDPTPVFRYYTPLSPGLVLIDDLCDFDTLDVDQNADGIFEESWVENVNFHLAPFNAAADGWPWTSLILRTTSSSSFPSWYARSVKLTGKFGWLAVPTPIKEATSLLATQLFKRVRDAPFGIVGTDVAVHIARTDPHISLLITDYIREKP